MYRRICNSLTLFLLVFSAGLWAASPSLDKQTKPKVMEIGISMSIPPWVIKENDQGIELDILRASLDQDVYHIKPVYLPFERAYKLFDAGMLDAVMNATASVASKGYLSEPVVTFQNYAISLAAKNFSTDISMSFLNDKSVAGFQKAKHLLGKEYALMAAKNERYQEVVKQDLQVNLLFIRELYFIVMDKSIFGYHWHQSTQNTDYTPAMSQRFYQEVRFHPLFKPSPYPFLFKDKALRDDFNRGLAAIKADGRYQQVLDNYDYLSDLYKQSRSQ